MSAPDDQWHDEHRDTLREVGRLTAEWERLDEERRICRAAKMKEHFGLPEWKAEAEAVASFEYAAAVQAVYECKRDLEQAKAILRDMDTRFDAWRSVGANLRSGLR